MVFEKCCITTRTKVISIHALREEGDFTPTGGAIRMMIFLSTPSARRATAVRGRSTAWCSNFYPRPPRGGRPLSTGCALVGKLFLSTPSARRATTWRPLISQGERFLSTPSARRATGGAKDSTDAVQISIHALREEGDRCLQRVPYPHRCISIHALREEGDDAYTAMKSSDKISIHALREEGDRLRIPLKAELSEYFYPRPPRGGRRPFT